MGHLQYHPLFLYCWELLPVSCVFHREVGGVCRGVYGGVWVRQVPLDEDHVHQSSQKPPYHRTHQGDPEPVVVTPEVSRHTDKRSPKQSGIQTHCTVYQKIKSNILLPFTPIQSSFTQCTQL